MDTSNKEQSPEFENSPIEPEENKEPSIEEESKQWHEKYLLTLAEMENLRKRLHKEKGEMLKFAVENVLSDFLNPIDQLENALGFSDHMSPETKNWVIGFQMILGQLKEVLHQNGVSVFKSVGTHFNPHEHEAVETEETSTHPEGTVLFEFTKGYRCGDRILRPARVKVAKRPQEVEAATE